MGRWVDVKGLEQGESFAAYVAEPAGTPKAAIVVIQEIFGINPGIRAKCDKLAKDGYLAIAPDLFWRMEPRVELDPDIADQLEKAFGFFGKFDIDSAIRDIEATIRHARNLVDGGKVGAVGYCLGGLLAYLTATRTDVDATVGYYGVNIDARLGESHAIARPLMLHFAQKDHFVPQDAIDRVRAGLDANAHVSIHEYPNVDHGFAAEMGSRRVEDAANLADGRTSAFFKQHLA